MFSVPNEEIDGGSLLRPSPSSILILVEPGRFSKRNFLDIVAIVQHGHNYCWPSYLKLQAGFVGVLVQHLFGQIVAIREHMLLSGIKPAPIE
jgi:hypothetical protein